MVDATSSAHWDNTNGTSEELNGNKHRKRRGRDDGKVTLEVFQNTGSLVAAAHEKPITSFKNFGTNSEQCRRD